MQPPIRHRRHHLPRLLLAALLLLASASLAQAEAPATEGYPPQEIAADRSCAACGMYPALYPEWQTQIIFKDKAMAAFDGGKCMFRFLHNLARFDSAHTAADVAMIWVKDFSTGTWTDGTKAFYVVGSSIMGPMGKELIPFASQAAAQKFQQQNGGTIEPYATISMATIAPLMGGMMHMRQGQQPMPAQ